MNPILTIQDYNEPKSSTCSDFKIFRKGDLIFRQGALSEGFYLLKKGAVKLQQLLPNGSQTILRIVLPGDFFGDGAPNQETTNLTSAWVMEEDTLVQKLPVQNFSLSELNQELTCQLLELNKRMGIRHARFLVSEAEDRIKYSLYDLAIKKGRRFGDETLLKINLTHEEIAFLADTSRQMVSKTLSHLKRSGLINYSRNRFLFRNIQAFKPTTV
ncbi:Crp/Fnr family transcriptional regulator [Algoriphagus halophilus]|uniref:Transcriptional regulator, Crp/Fnr family n=1 Tax=Algoriphagus halophilus TaxID=226505 RepID=A0A1N6EKW5_9BACT|nr:Crp/Fnr family transcriptional regulator [Algoriphagus halophilus]SIN83692.1 transcriptional regulator, Crp/Fnr family [Algoriphagus halophilus]